MLPRHGKSIRRRGKPSSGPSSLRLGAKAATLKMHKYPRTPHLEGSRLQPGDEDLEQIPRSALDGCHLVVAEKIDGANAGVSFTAQGELQLQSRGHYLTGGPRERQFAQLKSWAACHCEGLWRILGRRYVMFGEWVYAKHTIYYDQLPHFFLEFDLLDTDTGEFLDIDHRHGMLSGSPVVSVPVLARGRSETLPPAAEMVTRARFKSPGWQQGLRAEIAARRLELEPVLAETDPSDLAEGIYVKAEADGKVVGRFKWLRPSFRTTVANSARSWLDRPLVPNALRPGVDIYEPSR